MDALQHNTDKKPRAVLLYRASTKKQTDSENDIPQQRDILRPWVDRQGWEFIDEVVEGGVSGYKISADDRGKIQIIKKMAERREFDILGIYMSDRLGRIAEETPLIVSFLNARGIKVISYTEGEITANTHTDKLMTYIRYWQAEGESLKTSMRVTDAGEASVRQGKWRGGNAPYGYRSVSRGTLNYKGKPIFDVEIHPEQAEVIKTIFRLYAEEHYGGDVIARYLNTNDIPTTYGNTWNGSMIIKIIKNKIYTGIYELGKWTKKRPIVASPRMEHLVIIDDETFQKANAVREANNLVPNRKRPTRRGSLMLTGFLYCGECGGKYTSAHFHQEKTRKNGDTWVYQRQTYRCGSYRRAAKVRTACEHKVFTAEILEDYIVTDAKDFLLTVDKESLMTSHEDSMREQEELFADRLKKITREISQKEKELKKLKDEVIKVLMGESGFSQSLLTEMINTKEAELTDLRQKQIQAQAAVDDLAQTIKERRAMARELETWSERFDGQSTMDKKAMLLNIMESATVHEDDIEVVYNIRLEDEGTEDNTPPDGGYYNGGAGDSQDGSLAPPFSIYTDEFNINYTESGFDSENGVFLSQRFVHSCLQAILSTVWGMSGNWPPCARPLWACFSR